MTAIEEFVSESTPYATGNTVSAALQALQSISDIPDCPESVIKVIGNALQAIRSLHDLDTKDWYWALLVRITRISSSIIGRWVGKGEFRVLDDTRAAFQNYSEQLDDICKYAKKVHGNSKGSLSGALHGHNVEHKAKDLTDDLDWAEDVFAIDDEEIEELRSCIVHQLKADLQSITNSQSHNEQFAIPPNVNFLRQCWLQVLHSSALITYRMLRNISQLDNPDEDSKYDPRPSRTISDFNNPSYWLDAEINPTWFEKRTIRLKGYYTYYTGSIANPVIDQQEGGSKYTIEFAKEDHTEFIGDVEERRANAKVKGSLTGRKITFVKTYHTLSKTTWVYGGIITPWGLVGQWGKSLDKRPMGEFLLWIAKEEGAGVGQDVKFRDKGGAQDDDGDQRKNDS